MVVSQLSLLGKRWVEPTFAIEAIENLGKELGVSPTVAQLLYERRLTDPEEAYKFLHPKLDDLGAPELLPDFRDAINAILHARDAGELIYVHGDYDVDGVTSSAIFDRFLKKIGCKVISHVPHRMKEGYGISEASVVAAKEAGAGLLLTCDCGITAVNEAQMAKELGMKMVITDHHEPKSELPQAAAVVNPHVPGSRYPFKNLSGAGVAFRLCEGIAKEVDPNSVDSFRKHYIEFAALGTIADIMPLVSDNRIIAKFGLERLSQTGRKGLVALKAVSKIDGPVGAYDVGFKLGPRLNAAGRVDDADHSLQLLLTDNMGEAVRLADALDMHNQERRALQDAIAAEAVQEAQRNGSVNNFVIMAFNPSWHPGIVGIAAGRLKDMYNRPAFVGTIDPESGKGKASGRGIPGLSLAAMIEANRGIVEGGGHAMAAGIGFEASKFEEVRAAFESYARNTLTPEDLIPTVPISGRLRAEDVSEDQIQELQMFEPFGMANPRPNMVSTPVTIESVIALGHQKSHAQLHLKLENGSRVRGICFGQYSQISAVSTPCRAEFMFEPIINEFRGNRTVEWKISDLRVV